MNLLTLLVFTCISSISIANFSIINSFESTVEVIQNEKKITAIFDSYDGETYNFIGTDTYGEEFFFIAEKIDDHLLEKFDLKSDALQNTTFEIQYNEVPSGDTGNTIITITNLIKV